jgi:hypothetical protein
MAFYQDAASATSGSSYLTSLIATYKVSPRWVPILREIWVRNNAPSGGPDPSGSGFSNPLLGVSYLRPFGRDWRFGAFLSSTIPIGAAAATRRTRGRRRP